MILSIPREYFLILPTSSTLYDLLGGLGASLSGGVVGGVALSLAGTVGASGGGHSSDL